MIGTEIGSYRILEKLGEGGMGVVYRAIDTSLDRPVAIKVLSANLAGNPELVARFRSEAKAQANLNHTNLATLYAFLVQEGSACMVMELVDGETFEQMILRRGPIPGEEAIPLFKQALLGIGYAHRSGIVHRDIKPSNLMLNRNGIVKVMDFGIAKVMGVRGMTKTGTQMGTGWYMSPEQVLNRPVDIRSDIYSLGVTLYQMLSAHVPFEADSDFQIMSDHVHTPPPLPTRFYPYIPKGLENAVLKALEKNPDQRFQTVEEFGAALEQPANFSYATQPVAAPPPLPITSVPVTSPPAVQMPSSATRLEATVQPPPAASTPRMIFTPAGKAIAGGIGLVIVLAAGWMALRPKPSSDALPSRPAPQANTQTPLERQLSQPQGGVVVTNSASVATPPKVVAFGPNANAVTAGQTVHLSWSVSGASEVTISPGVGTVKPEGGIDVPLRKTTEFTLIAKNEKGESATSTATVTVAQAEPARPVSTPTAEVQRPQQPQSAPPPIPPARIRPGIDFAAIPNQIRQGGGTSLRWSITNAQSATIEPVVGALRQANGEYRVNPVETTTYTLTATSADGTAATASTTVQVIPAPAPPPVQRAAPAVSINVYHDHGANFAGNNMPMCWGQLSVSQGHLIYRTASTNDGRRDDFDVVFSEVQEVAQNRMPIRNQPAFHLTIGKQHFNFIPAGLSSTQAVSVLQGAIQAR